MLVQIIIKPKINSLTLKKYSHIIKISLKGRVGVYPINKKFYW